MDPETLKARSGTLRSGVVQEVERVSGYHRDRETYPTPSATSYGSNRGGAAGRTGKIRYSLHSLARMGDLPGHPEEPLRPAWVEWLMGFPLGWTVTSTVTERSA